jgi:ADP-heptose:LPS heptosyltransferase
MALSHEGAVRPRVLALRALGLGDFCTAVPAFRALRRAFPRHELVLAAPAWQGPLAELAGIDRLAPTRALAPVPRREAVPAVAVNLHGRGPQSTQRLLDTAPDHLICFRHPVLPQTDESPRWAQDEHEVHRWCRLLGEYGIDADPTELALQRPRVRSRAAQRVVIHAGAAAEGRRWPPRQFASVARRLLDQGECIVLTGAADEQSIADAIVTELGCDRSDAVLNMCGRTSIEALCAIVAEARAVVSNDTGTAHLAYAYRVPSVVLFGPTSPAQWGPPPGPHAALWRGQPGDPHAAQLHSGLASITPDEVIDALASLI